MLYSMMLGVISLMSLHITLTSGILRLNTYKQLCDDSEDYPYMSLRSVHSRNSIECVALCQQDDQCSSVHYHNNQCSLFIGNETSCDERTVPRTAGHKYLEKVSSNWCSNGGQMTVNETECVCTSDQYQGKFCQIGKQYICHTISKPLGKQTFTDATVHPEKVQYVRVSPFPMISGLIIVELCDRERSFNMNQDFKTFTSTFSLTLI